MNDAERRILDLLEKFHNETATDDDLAELDRWYASFDNDPKLTTGFSKEKLAATGEGMFRNIRRNTGTESGLPYLRKSVWRRGLIPALTLSAVALFFIIRTGPAAHKVQVMPDVMPGRNVAVLTLSNGKQIDLNLAKKGLIYSDDGFDITKTSGSVITYRAKAGNIRHDLRPNQLSTPSGGQFSVILSDGSEVWLNAMSSLTFPARFTGNKRPVSLTGEAYFEIAKNKAKPFDVSTATQSVEVLGTHFNISAYTDETLQRTTLLEGSVRVTTREQHVQVTIKPGQQATGDAGGLRITNVDAGDAAGWKDGFFVFNHTELHDLMRQLSRWYNIDIAYQGSIKPRAFSGSIDRSYTLLQALDVLKISKVNFKIEKSADPEKRGRLTLIP